MTEKRKLSVFLSYAAGDILAAQTLYRQLTAEGWLDVWFEDKDLLVGQRKNDEIGTTIQNIDIAIICISKKAAKEAGPFHKQLRLLLDKAEEMPQGAIFIIPLRLEECEPPYVLRELQFANYFENNREKVYPHILRSLQKRASELKITMAVKTTPDSPKITAKTDDTSDETSAGIAIQQSVSNSAIVSGNHNVINIYNHKSEHADEE